VLCTSHAKIVYNLTARSRTPLGANHLRPLSENPNSRCQRGRTPRRHDEPGIAQDRPCFTASVAMAGKPQAMPSACTFQNPSPKAELDVTTFCGGQQLRNIFRPAVR
jgi:hypothetical protein